MRRMHAAMLGRVKPSNERKKMPLGDGKEQIFPVTFKK